MSRFATILLVLVLLPLALGLGQACTGCEDHVFESTNSKSANDRGLGGDGEPIDAKPAPGEYARIIPGFSCRGEPRIPGRMHVTSDSIRVKSVDAATCEETESRVTFEQVEHSGLLPNSVGFGSGVYSRVEVEPDPARPAAQIVEALCFQRPTANRAVHVEISINSLTSRLEAKLVGAGKSENSWTRYPERSLQVGREVSSSVIRYNAGDFLLTFPRIAYTNGKGVPGRLITNFAGASIDTEVECRSASVFDALADKRAAYSIDFGGGVLPQGLSFVRASQGTYFDAAGVLQTAATGIPRFEFNPADQKPGGLLVEERRTNLFRHSNDFLQQPAWDQNGATDPTITPNGQWLGLNRFKLERSRDYQYIWTRIIHKVTIEANKLYTTSWFVQAGNVSGTRLFVWMRPGDEINVDFDLANGTSSVFREQLITHRGSTMTKVPGGYRVSVSFISAEAGQIDIGVGPLSDQVGSFIYAAGAQLEEGAQPTSFIHTADTPVTREADHLSLLETTWFQPQAGTFEMIGNRIFANEALAPVAPLLALTNGSDEYSFAYNAGAGFIARMQVAGSGGTLAVSGAVNGRATTKLHLAYANGDSSAAFMETITRAPANYPTGLSPLRVEFGGSTSERWNGYIKAFTYWPQRFDDEALRVLSR